MNDAPVEAGAKDDSFVVRAQGVGLSYGKARALREVTLDIPAGCMVGLIGPDGVGKSSLLSLVAGARTMQQGRIEVLGGDISDKRHLQSAYPRIAYMPQGLGKNLYPTLSVFENIDFSDGCSDIIEKSVSVASSIFWHARACRLSRIARLASYQAG